MIVHLESMKSKFIVLLEGGKLFSSQRLLISGKLSILNSLLKSRIL